MRDGRNEKYDHANRLYLLVRSSTNMNCVLVA